MTGRNYKVDLS